MKPRIYIGIDTGVNTGIAVWDSHVQAFVSIDTVMIHQAMDKVKLWVAVADVKVRVEDARKRKVFGERGDFNHQGVGSVKRDAKMWQDFLKGLGCEFEMVAPKNNMTKVKAQYFNRLTGWKEKTNEHARDAAMLVFKM